MHSCHKGSSLPMTGVVFASYNGADFARVKRDIYQHAISWCTVVDNGQHDRLRSAERRHMNRESSDIRLATTR